MKTAAVVLLALVGGSAQAKDTFYRCGHDSSYEEISMAIQNDGSATEILIRSQNGDRTYYITKTAPLSYRAETKNSSAPEAYSSLELDRVSNELRIQERISDATASVLAEVCKRNIPISECKAMVDKVNDQHAFLCMTIQDGQCPRWIAGVNTFKGTARYLCHQTPTDFYGKGAGR